jgi:FkbM family methyltransferase
MSNLVTETGRVYAFEPIRRIVDFLEIALRKDGISSAVEIHCNALGDRKCTAEFIIERSRPPFSHIRRKGEDIRADCEAINVEVVRLDDLLIDRAPKINFMKLDLEGSDFLGLKGAESIISRDGPVIMFENTGPWGGRQYGYSSAEFFDFFGRLNYEVHDVNNFPITPETWEADYLSHEAICGRRRSLELYRARSLIDGFWRGLDDRSVLGTWPETNEAMKDPFEYLLTAF